MRGRVVYGPGGEFEERKLEGWGGVGEVCWGFCEGRKVAKH